MARPPNRTKRGPAPSARHFFSKLNDTERTNAAYAGRTTSEGRVLRLLRGTGSTLADPAECLRKAIGFGIWLGLTGRAFSTLGFWPSAKLSPNKPSWRCSTSALSRLPIRHLRVRIESGASFRPAFVSGGRRAKIAPKNAPK